MGKGKLVYSFIVCYHGPSLEHSSTSEALAQVSTAPLATPSVHSHDVALMAARATPGVPFGSNHHSGLDLGHAGLGIILCPGLHTSLPPWQGSLTDCPCHVPRSDR